MMGGYKSLSGFKNIKIRVLLGLFALGIVALLVFSLLIPHLKEQQTINTADTGGPYGFTVLTNFRQETVEDLKQLHMNWVRYQLNWVNIEPEPGHYNWQLLDNAVALANANGIHITFPLQGAPPWAQSQVCAHRHFLPGADEMAAFANTVALRYNNQNGHGYIDSYEVGNEEFDSLWTGDWNESLSCRKPTFYGPVLKAAYVAIKTASPRAIVGMGALWWVNTPHVHEYMNWLYQNQYGSYFDFANFHYYTCNDDPAVTKGDRPSFNEEWQTIHSIMAQHNDGSKPIWVTELGWNTTAVAQDPHCVVTPQVQSQFIIDTASAAMNSHIIRHIFWYTIDRENDGMSLTQPAGKLPGFYALQDFIRQHPQWP